MNRRHLPATALGFAGYGAVSSPITLFGAQSAAAQPRAAPAEPAVSGFVNASEFGVRPDGRNDQSRAFSVMLEKATQRNAPIFLPPGDYIVSSIQLPRNTRISGVRGASRIVYGSAGRQHHQHHRAESRRRQSPP